MRDFKNLKVREKQQPELLLFVQYKNKNNSLIVFALFFITHSNTYVRILIITLLQVTHKTYFAFPFLFDILLLYYNSK